MSDYYDRENQESIAALRGRRATGSTVHEHMECSSSPDYSPELHSSLIHGYYGGPGNGERTVQMLRGAQSTYGNQATHRFVQRSTPEGERRGDDEDGWLMGWIKAAGRAAQTKAPDAVRDADGEIGEARNARTAVSGALRAAREGTKAMATAAPHAHRTNILGEVIESLGLPGYTEYLAAMESYDDATEFIESAPKSGLAGGLEKWTGRDSLAGKTLAGANYGLQFLQNWSQGQDFGEALAGAAGGGFTSNFMPRHLFKESPKVGWTDTVVNVSNAALQLAGAPEEIGGFTQAAADATPTGFATSVVSNAMRGVWNVGEGLITGDWSGIKQQGEDMVEGRSGAPLQGLAMLPGFIFGSGDSGGMRAKISDKMTSNEAERGEYGMLPALGNMIGDDWWEMGDRPGGFGAAFSDMGEFIWGGAHGKGGIKGGANWLGDKLFGEAPSQEQLLYKLQRLYALRQFQAEEQWRESARRSGWDGKRMPIRTGGSGERAPIRTGGSDDEQRVPIAAGGSDLVMPRPVDELTP